MKTTEISSMTLKANYFQDLF